MRKHRSDSNEVDLSVNAPKHSTALGSNTPTSKSVIIRLAPVANATSL